MRQQQQKLKKNETHRHVDVVGVGKCIHKQLVYIQKYVYYIPTPTPDTGVGIMYLIATHFPTLIRQQTNDQHAPANNGPCFDKPDSNA